MSKLAMQEMGDSVKKFLPKEFGFTLIVFPYQNSNGVSNYISTANREDMVKMLRETADKLEGKEDFETPSNNIY